jgi:DNA-binding IclR family transcriptional regulator
MEHSPAARSLTEVTVESGLEEAILLALRRSPGSHANELAQAAGLPRTNFGRQLKNRLRRPLQQLLTAGLVEEHDGRYQLTANGRRRLSERKLDAT